MRCTCGYESDQQQDVNEHIVIMSSVLGISDPDDHFPTRD